MRPDAVFLDMDGVIIDSEPHYKKLEDPIFRKLMPGWSDEDHLRIVGVGIKELHPFLAKEYGLALGKPEFLALCNDIACEVYEKHVNLEPGLTHFLAELSRERIPVGIVSASPRRFVESVVKRFDLGKVFSGVVTGDDAEKLKPEPDIYLEAARRLKVLPPRCVAVEDSNHGVLAATRAGMFCVAFRNGHNDSQDLSAGHWEARGFASMSLSELERRMAARAKTPR